jgi:probable phosphoglycerate mutase
MSQSTGPQSLAYTHLIVIRHGETAWNRERRLQGQLDIPLNERAARRRARWPRRWPASRSTRCTRATWAAPTAAPLAQALGLRCVRSRACASVAMAIWKA